MHHLVDAFAPPDDSPYWRAMLCSDGKIRFVYYEEFDQ